MKENIIERLKIVIKTLALKDAENDATLRCERSDEVREKKKVQQGPRCRPFYFRFSTFSCFPSTAEDYETETGYFHARLLMVGSFSLFIF